MKILVIDDKANTLGYHRKKLLTTLQQQSNIDYQLIEPEPSILEAELAKVESNEYDINLNKLRTSTGLHYLITFFYLI